MLNLYALRIFERCCNFKDYGGNKRNDSIVRSVKHSSDSKTEVKEPFYITMVITCFRPYSVLLFRQKSDYASSVGSCK